MGMHDEALPIYPERALSSKSVLYRPMQDIDIYVEDEGSEAFYTELFNRLVESEVRIATVAPLRGRDNVIKKAAEYSESYPALFLIDGDLYWVAGMTPPAIPHLYVHPCYCVENVLFCERAMVQIVVENRGDMRESDAETQLNWNAVRKQLEEHLVPLFVEFAVAFALCPEIKTVARGIGCVLRDSQKGCIPRLDTGKIVAVRDDVKAQILKRVDIATYRRKRTSIEDQIRVLGDPLDAVSGKDFLVPVQMFEAGRIGGQKMQRKSFTFRLARHCSLDKLGGLRDTILRVVKSGKAK